MTYTEVIYLLLYVILAAGLVIMPLLRRQWVPSAIAVAGCIAAVLLGTTGLLVLVWDQPLTVNLWMLRGIGSLHIDVDRLSALFMVGAAFVFLPVSLFTAGYARRYLDRYSVSAMGVHYLALFAAITLLLSADTVLLFLLAWEAVAIFSYLLVNFEHDNERSRNAAYTFLAMAEVGTVAVVIAFLLLSRNAGSLDFAKIRGAGGFSSGIRWAVFLLSFFGFGVKAGIVPVNSWLPRAHPAAPANVSAVLSGVVLNMGLYGMLRVNGDLLPPAGVGPGVVALAVGAISALVGILYATTSNDLKTMLAHSSTENIGIVTTGFGASFVFSAAGRADLAAFLLIAALYHMINHSVYKSLLFMGAGSIDEAVGNRELDRLGGLAKWMPLTSIFFLIGALSISGVPPFSGFTSEWLTLQGLLRGAELASRGLTLAFVLAGVLLALTAALAVTCFVKAFGMGFLGMPRTLEVRHAKERKALTLVSLGFPALLSLLLGIFPTYVIPAIDHAVRPVVYAANGTDQLVPPFFSSSPSHGELPKSFVQDFHNIGAQVGQSVLPGRGEVVMHRGGSDQHIVFAMSPFYMTFLLLLLGLLTYAAVRIVTRKRQDRRENRWDGGLRRLLPEMTYTATGFSNPVRVIFRAIFRPRTIEDGYQMEARHFRTAITKKYEEVHIVNRLLLNPVTRAARAVAALLARMHNGRINSYVMYVLLTLAAFCLVAWLLR